MANTQVTLVWRCKTEKGWRYYQPIHGRNGRVRTGVVIVDGFERRYPEGRFQLRHYEGAKVIYKDIGPDATKALDQKLVLENLLKTRITAPAAGVQIVEDETRTTLTKAYKAFLQRDKDNDRREAEAAHRTALDDFFRVVPKTYVDELTKEDMDRYVADLRKRKKSPRTIYNRWNNVKAFFIHCDLDLKAMKLKTPEYEEKTVEVYEQEETKALFDSLRDDDPRAYTIFQIMHKCGLREQEAMHLEWSQLNLKRGMLHVKGNPHFDFHVKEYEQRNIPIPESLQKWLQTYRAEHPDDQLVTPTEDGQPDGHWLRALKVAARSAGLNCNDCDGCRKLKECKRWFLHKFRATAITLWLRSKEDGGAGFDLRTVMKLSGHKDLASVMRYLSPAHDDSVRKGVDRIDWGD